MTGTFSPFGIVMGYILPNYKRHPPPFQMFMGHILPMDLLLYLQVPRSMS